jgi:hypothetical protein
MNAGDLVIFNGYTTDAGDDEAPRELIDGKMYRVLRVTQHWGATELRLQDAFMNPVGYNGVSADAAFETEVTPFGDAS